MSENVSLIDLQREAPNVCLRTIQRVLSTLEIRAPFGEDARRVVAALRCWHEVMGTPRRHARACMLKVLAEVRKHQDGVVIWDGSKAWWQSEASAFPNGLFVVNVANL